MFGLDLWGNMKSEVFTLLRLGAALVLFSLMTTPTLAYWQFFERPPGIEVKPSPRYASKKECEEALKKTEAALKKAYPDRYPLVGSCEEYR
jgi:hypothetical protein